VERTGRRDSNAPDVAEDPDARVTSQHDDGFEPARADVLVIDDSAIGRAAVVRLLRRAGISVMATDTAIGATRLIVRSSIKVVVADLHMPAMQGTALLRLVRQHPRLGHVALILLSGVGAQELVAAAREVEADAAIAKLEMGSTLVPTVNRLLRRATRPVQVSGPFSLPPSILVKKSSTG
jgi:CheY-like chemotaxis protein